MPPRSAPAAKVRLGFRVGGKLLARPAEVGQRVRAGEVLARLDPEDLRLSQQAAAAAVQAAQVGHDLSLADFRRFKELRDQGFISGAELDRREAALKAAAAQLEQARAQAAVQGNQAAYATLVATAPGVVVAVEAEPGSVLAGLARRCCGWHWTAPGTPSSPCRRTRWPRRVR